MSRTTATGCSLPTASSAAAPSVSTCTPKPVPAQVEPDEVGDGAVVLDDEDETARVGVGHWSCLRAAGGGADRVTDRVRAGTRSPTCRTGVRVDVAFDGVDRGLDAGERVR